MTRVSNGLINPLSFSRMVQADVAAGLATFSRIF